MAASRPARAPLTALRPPVALSSDQLRFHRRRLALIALLGCIHVVTWSSTMVVWSPIDEVAHYGYVQSIAEGDGVPVIGRDLISDEVMASVKESPTTIHREEPYRPTNADANWGALRHQYEASSAPIYYALMAVPYRLGHIFGLTGAVLAVRLATGLLGLLAVPLTWAIARRFLPERPAVWLVAPALLITVNAFAFGTVTNDPLGVVVALGAVLALARTLEPGALHVGRRAAVAGAALGIGLAGKATILVVVPVMLALVVGWWITTRPPWRRVATIALVAGSSTVASVLPWLVWNVATYGALSGLASIHDVLPPDTASFSWGRLAADARVAHVGLFANQVTRAGAYDLFWTLTVLGLPAVAAIVAARRRARQEAATVVACAVTLPLAFVMSEVTNFTIMAGAGAPVGRHLLPALPFAMIGAAAALSILAPRRVPSGVWLGAGLLITASLTLEARLVTDLVQRAYQRTVHDDALSPFIDQPWSDHVIPMQGFSVDAPCPVAAFELGFASAAPPTLTLHVRRPDGSIDASRTLIAAAERTSNSLPLYDPPAVNRTWYRLALDVTGPFEVVLPPGSLVNASVVDRAPSLAILPAGQRGDPTVTVSCRQPGGRALAFRQSYPIHHPSGVTEPMLVWTPRAEAALTGGATLSGTLLARRRRPR